MWTRVQVRVLKYCIQILFADLTSRYSFYSTLQPKCNSCHSMLHCNDIPQSKLGMQSGYWNSDKIMMKHGWRVYRAGWGHDLPGQQPNSPRLTLQRQASLNHLTDGNWPLHLTSVKLPSLLCPGHLTWPQRHPSPEPRPLGLPRTQA